MTINSDKDTYKTSETANYTVNIENNNEDNLKNVKVKISYLNAYDLSNIFINGKELDKNLYTVDNQNGFFVINLNDRELIKGDKLEVKYTTALKDVQDTEYISNAELIANDVSIASASKTIKFEKVNTSTADKENTNIVNNTTTDNQNKVDKTQTGDNNLVVIIQYSLIFIFCIGLVGYFIKKKH